MRKLFLFLVLGLFLLPVFSSAATSALFGPGLQYQATSKFQPLPAEPGRPLDAWVVFKRTAPGSVDQVQCQLGDSYPFISTEEEKIKSFGSVSEGQEITVRLKLRVDEKAPIGSNSLVVECKSELNPWSKIEIPVNVQPSSAQLVISQVDLNPEFLPPGGVSTLNVEVSNPTGLLLRNVRVKLDFVSNDLPVAPFQSNAQKVINQLNPGEKLKITYVLTASSDAVSKLYKIPLTINYQDSIGTEYELKDTLGVVVRSPSDVKVLLDESTVYKGGQNGKVVLRIVNRGASSVKAIEVAAIPGVVQSTDKMVSVIGNNVQYVSSINGEEDDTVEFSVFTSTDAKDYVSLPVMLHFKDQTGMDYNQTEWVSIPIYSQADALRYDLEKQAGPGIVTIIIVLAILGYVGYKYVLPRFKKKQ